MNTEALAYLLYKLADDDLIIGHRNSEWTGIGPILEEDISFASMAQDQLGHAYAYYKLLESLGAGNPDHLAFMRDEKEMKCCHLVEYPIGEYSFSLVRHFLYDYAKVIRMESLTKSSYAPLAKLAKKIVTELRYHQLHAKVWMTKLGKANEESRLRMQTALQEGITLAYSLFEPHSWDTTLVEECICTLDETTLQQHWEKSIFSLLEEGGYQKVNIVDTKAAFGGRNGYHTTHLQPMLDEMTVVYRIDPNAEW